MLVHAEPNQAYGFVVMDTQWHFNGVSSFISECRWEGDGVGRSRVKKVDWINGPQANRFGQETALELC